MFRYMRILTIEWLMTFAEDAMASDAARPSTTKPHKQFWRLRSGTRNTRQAR